MNARRHPLILGHRGLPAEAPENTLSSFRKALEAGADGVELDVRLARDGVPVVVHDATMHRTTEARGTVDELDSEEIRLCSVRWRGRAITTVHVPTLREVLKDLPPGTVVDVELKPQHGDAEMLAAAVLDACACARDLDLVFSSFDLEALRALQRRRPEARLWLNCAWAAGFALRQAQRGRLQGVAFWHPLVTPWLVRHAHELGLEVAAWPVNGPDRARTLARWGVDTLITDRRAVIQAFA
ncbi:MAG: glycerophosphodiester phosphodiesterase [Firmicutes bacterium]|nr:glycerophosphodiester phosphodiesterase [Bacillota bacterium]